MLRRSTLAFLVAAAFATSADALDTFGPRYGANKYTTSIQSADGIADEDDYVSSLLAGEKLSVVVTANKGSSLLPTLALIDPDGNLSSPPVVEKSGGKSVSLKNFVATKSGRWGVRVAGKNATQGAYTIAFKIGAAPRVPVVKKHLGGSDPIVADLLFNGIDGALLDVTVTSSKKQALVHIGTVRDPVNAFVSTPAAAVKPGKATLAKAVLHNGDGAYKLQVYVDDGEANCAVTVRVTPQGRPKGGKAVVLVPSEPALTPLDAPIRGAVGGRVHITGSGFPSAASVFFGLLAGTNVNVASDGKSLDVTAPAGHDDAIVSVAIVAADGQAAVRDAYFHFVPPPKIVELTNTSGKPVHGGSTKGGTQLRLVGTAFNAAATVRIDTRPAVITQVVGSTRIDLTTPLGTVGLVPLTLQDEFGRSTEAPFLYEYKSPAGFSITPFAYSPSIGKPAGGTAITITGLNFEPADQLVLNGVDIASTFVSTSKRTFVSPTLAPGFYPLAIVDRFGSTSPGPDFEVRAAPVISTVTAIAGPRIGTGSIALGGGASVQVNGLNLAATDTPALGGAAGTVTASTSTQLVFTAPPGSPGLTTLTITDEAGQSASLANALRYVGYKDETGIRQPGGSAVDDLSALRGAMDDLDGDGKADDLVMVSDTSLPGSRNVLTRLFFGASSKLTDATNSNFPPSGGDPQGIDDFHAAAVAIGDLDSGSGRDIVIAGAPTMFTYSYYNPYYGYTYTYTYYYYDARVFTNDGTGSFSFSYGSPRVRTWSVDCTGGGGGSYAVFTPGPVNLSARATALAVGDIDHDGQNDIVMATDHYRTGRVQIPLNFVTFNAGAPGSYSDPQASSHYQYNGTAYYAPALRVFQNRESSSGGFEDATFPRIPLAGTSGSTLPAFPGRDVKLGDIDHDTNHTPDIVVTWDDPLTTTPKGMMSPGSDAPRTATRILLNNGSGFFGDATGHWLPAAQSPEFWQGNRVALADLDGDGDLDLVIVVAQSTDAFQGAPTFTKPALRILRNDGAVTGFVDVTATAVPSVPLAGTKDDNLRGTSLVVRDVDGDGFADILVGTSEVLVSSSGTRARSTRLLRGATGLVFSNATDFLPLPSADSGEANDLLLGDIAGNPDPSLVLLTEVHPLVSPNSESLRVQDWRR